MIGASDGDLNSHIYDTWCVLIRVFIQMNFGLLIYCYGRMQVQKRKIQIDWKHSEMKKYSQPADFKGVPVDFV